jgi:predicted nucleic acid-binding protein
MEWEDPPGDASTLIYLAKADGFGLASSCVDRLLVPPSVWREAVEEGDRIAAPEVPRIHAAAGAGFLARVELASREQRDSDEIATGYRLGLGESEVLAVARAGGTAVVDEGRASRVARSLGILSVSTLFLPVLGVRRQSLSTEEAVGFLRSLAVVVGARAEVVFEIEQRLREHHGH